MVCTSRLRRKIDKYNGKRNRERKSEIQRMRISEIENIHAAHPHINQKNAIDIWPNSSSFLQTVT